MTAAPVLDAIDLHMLRVRVAEVRLKHFLRDCCKNDPGSVVKVITGRGRHSTGGAVLRPVVRRLLNGRLAPYVRDFRAEWHDGAFLVEVR